MKSGKTKHNKELADFNRERYMQRQEMMQQRNSAMFLAFIAVILFTVFVVSVIGGFLAEGANSIFFLIIGIITAISLGIAAIFGIRMHCARTTFEDVISLRPTLTKSRSEEESPGSSYGDVIVEEYDEEEGLTIEEKPTDEVEAPRHNQSVFGDMSALSPRSFEGDSERYRAEADSRDPSTIDPNDRYHEKASSAGTRNSWATKAIFNANSTSTSSEGRSSNGSRGREDPPDEDSLDRRGSYEPSARRFKSDGTIEEESIVDDRRVDTISESRSAELNSQSTHAAHSMKTAAANNTSKIEQSETESTTMSETVDLPLPPPRPQSNHPAIAPPTPLSRSGTIPFTPTSSVVMSPMGAPSPKASEAGSSVSSLFLKPFNKVFGRRKSENGTSDTPKGSQVSFMFGNESKHGGKPPKALRSSSGGKLDTISGPSAFPSISQKVGMFDPEKAFVGAPSPRAPSVAASEFSEIQSEFQSNAGVSDVASSTYDPEEHARAVRKTQRNRKSLGMAAVSNDKQNHFEKDDADVAEAAAAAAVAKRKQEEKGEQQRENTRKEAEEAAAAEKEEESRLIEQRRNEEAEKNRQWEEEERKRLQGNPNRYYHYQEKSSARRSDDKSGIAAEYTRNLNKREQAADFSPAMFNGNSRKGNRQQIPLPPPPPRREAESESDVSDMNRRHYRDMGRNTRRTPDMESDVPESDFSDFNLNRAGVYDVFAPPGPIGVVVDSTPNGPVVHSLKKSSPMMNLIVPGDRILALDEADVRRLNAAQVTKLMAKKSQNTQRKITLMAVSDGF